MIGSRARRRRDRRRHHDHPGRHAATRLGSRLLAGARSGAAATGTMTAVFAAFDAVGWLGQLPPRQIIARLLPTASEPTKKIATAIGHTGYGAAIGAGYALLPRHRSTALGALWGVLVCAANYEALLPALGIRQPLHRDHRREIAALVVAHIVYGVELQRRLQRNAGVADNLGAAADASPAR